ncbi:TonB-dependent receptor [Chitinophaga sp. Cy-1792]|uniref:SusC/RagA family TonB-linked outer membrane protein n=1 Tax=Chitinophaga sp. Cy-1792 TaxID=2608339 RepID=UPI001962E183|nr:TonB-dependent receptor [Chitinophaga sp. Cy-1792]
MMKLSSLLILIAVTQLHAETLAQKVTVYGKNLSLAEIFQQVKKQTNYQFFYQDELLSDAKVIREINMKNAPLKDFMDVCFKDQPLTYDISEKTITVKALPAGQQRADIHGRVTDSTGLALPGVSIHIKGTSKGVITNVDGTYSINANPGDVLVFSFIGYDQKEVTVQQGNTVNVTLSASTGTLKEVVVNVGYGSTKKVHLTGAVASVGSEKLANRPLVNLADGLQGQVPGLNVSMGNGQPGTSATFNIRGLPTIGGAGQGSPLVLVDGVERDPNLINPSDVESVTVLKDAASATIYGGRAAYGVILITTKRGKTGEPSLNYSGSYSMAKPANLPKYVDSKGYLSLFNQAQYTGSITGGYTSTSPFTAKDSAMIMAYYNDPKNNPDMYVDPANPNLYRYVGNTNWVKVLYPGWAPMQQHNVSLSGGTEKLTYMASMGYFAQDGLQKSANQAFRRYTPNLKMTSKVTDWLSLDLNMSMTRTTNNKPALTLVNGGGSWMPGDLRPVMPVTHPDGNYSGQGSFTNPMAINALSGRDVDNVNDYWATARATITPVKHLSIITDYTWNSNTDYDKANLVPFNEYGVNGVFLDVYPWTKTSRVIETRWNNTYYAFNSYATYDNTFNNVHAVKAMVGFNQEYRHYINIQPTAVNIIVPSIPSIGLNNDPKPSISSLEAEYALIGTFFRVNYAYKDKYLLEVNGRYDGTSRFQQGHRYVFSPSVSAGWDISREKFMQNVTLINQLKLRASYGNLPNQRAADNTISISNYYPTLSTMGTGITGYLFNNQPGIVVTPPGLVRNDLTWEKIATSNFGLDYALLNERLIGSFDYFVTNTTGLITAGQQLPAVLGTTAPKQNTASLRTNGWEFNITWRDRILHNQLKYAITVNLSDALTTVTKYDQNPTGSIDDLNAGRKMGEIWGYTTEGFYKTDAEAQAVDNSRLAGYKWLAGDIKYKDLNGDNKINDGKRTLADHGDLSVIGNTQPRYKFGVNLNLEYKGFDFTAFIQGLLKQDFDPTGSTVFNAFSYGEWNIPYAYALNSWTPENTNAYFPRVRFSGSGNQQTQTKYLQKAAYARLKQLTLGYNFPNSWFGNSKIKNVRVYLTGENLFKVTSLFGGFDPDLVSGYSQYPLNKTLSAGIQVGL